MEEKETQDFEAPEETEASPAESSGDKEDESVDALKNQVKALYAQTQRYKKRYQDLKQNPELEEPAKEPEKKPTEDAWKEKIEFIAINRDVDLEDVDLLIKLKKQGESLSEAKSKYSHLLKANQEKRQSENKSLSPSAPNKDSGYQTPTDEEMDEIIKDPQKHKEWEEKLQEHLSRTGSKTEA